MKKVGVVIYTYNRVDDARINMEIIRNTWKQSEYLQDVKIVHSFNGKKEWYPKRYLEDDLIVTKNSWHFQGASDLIDAGVKKFQKKYKGIDYLIILAADTWLINVTYLEGLLKKMEDNDLYLATCAWGLPDRNDLADVGIAADFFIVDLKWATRHSMFPIRYREFYEKYGELFLYQKSGNVMLEKLLLTRYFQALSREEKMDGVARRKAIEKTLRIKEREPIHSHIDTAGNWKRNWYWPEMGLLTYHDPVPKQAILRKKKVNKGENIAKLLKSKDLAYFNNGTTRMKDSSN